jgi:signal transduction histidine kinase
VRRALRRPPVLAGLVCLAAVAAILGTGEYGLFERASGSTLWLALGPSIAWVVAGLFGWSLRPASITGPLMTAVGLSFLLSTVPFTAEPLPFTVAMLLWGAPLAFATHMYLVFPGNRVDLRFAGTTLVAAYAVMILPHAVETLFRDPREDFECSQCPENLALVHEDAAIADAAVAVGAVARAGLVALLLVALVSRWRSATPTARRALAPVLAASMVTAVVFIPYLATFRPGEPVWGSALGRAAALVAVVIPAAFLLGLLRTRLQRGGVAGLVVRLGAQPPAARVRDLLARALGDPSLELAFWRPGAGSYVDASGGAVTLPEPEATRAVTLLEGDGERLGALVHDRSLLENPELLEGVAAAARLALDNARLQAELRAQLREVRASRERIVQAGDVERRRIERNLHDGAQQRLLAIRLALRFARNDAGHVEPQLAQIDAELADTLDELRTLARGLHPPVLEQEGLAPALETLARRAVVPVEIEALPSTRLPPAVETAAYYVASEALANAGKHARASHVRIDLRHEGGEAVLEVVDDGMGGADADGSGLRGLRDRVEALDGSLTVESERGRGTMLRAVFPCG